VHQKQSADLTTYLALKVATFLWFSFVFVSVFYLLGATWADWWPYTALNLPEIADAKPAIYSVLGGVLGSALYAFRGFYWSVGPQSSTNPRYRYDPNWTLWYVARPITGAVTGAFMFAFLRAGAGTLGTVTHDGGSAGYFVASFLAGLVLSQALDWMAQAGQRAFSRENSAPVMLVKEMEDAG